MISRDNKKRSVSAPAVPYFIAVSLGILADARFSPGSSFWAAIALLAASASFALYWADRRRRRRPKNDASTLNGAECAEFVGVAERKDGEFSTEERAARPSPRVETPDRAAFWNAWLANAEIEKPEKRSENDGESPKSQDWNDALRRFLVERRRRGLPLVGVARFDDVGKTVETGKIGSSGKINGAGENGGEFDAAFERERLLFDFEGFDEFRVWDGESFSGSAAPEVGKRSDDPADWRAKLRKSAALVWRRRRGRAVAWIRAIPWRTVWAAVAVASLAGWRHDVCFNVFSDREIAFFVPEGNGTPATLELRTATTPTLYVRDEAIGARFGATETTTFEARVLRAKNGGVWEKFDGRIAVSVAGDATFLRIGDAIRVSGKLTRPPKVGNPGEYDRRYSLRSRRILTRIAVGGASDVEILPETGPRPWTIRVARALESVRLRAARTLNDELSPKNAAVASGMTFGFRNGIDDETNEAFRATGTIHLLSISGLHVSLVAAAFCVLLRLAGFSARWISVATVAFVFAYLGLTDMRTPVWRASLLIAILCGGVILRRRVVSLNALATTAVALLLWNPCELFQLGARLSFLATGVFLWSSRGNVRDSGAAASARLAAIRERRRTMASAKKDAGSNEKTDRDVANGRDENEARARRRRAAKSAARRAGRAIFGKLAALTKVGAVIWGVGTPLILSATNFFTPVAILANPLVWGPATLALLAALALAAFGTLGSFGDDLAAATGRGFGLDAIGALGVAALGPTTDRLFDVFLGTLDALRRAPFGTTRTASPPVWALWAFYLPLIFWTLFPKFRPTRKTAARALAAWLALWLVADVAAARRIVARDATRIEIFSVGHGISILALFPDGRTALFDCGSVSGAEKAAEPVARTLWNAGRTRIDLVVASHADFDHYGGLRTLVETVDIGRLCVSPAMFEKRDVELDALRDALERREIPIETVVGGESFERFGFPELVALHPTLEAGPLGDESNPNSLVVALERRGRRILFPGDLDAPNALFLRTPPTRFDLILAPHHGGKSENYRDLLDWADPVWVVVSGGSFQRNRETEDALRAEGRRVLHTLDDGRVLVEIERDPEKPENGVGKMRVSTLRSGKTFSSGDF